MPAAFTWIRTPGDLVALAGELGRADAVALDTEADSLHHYPERLCLVQVADAEGRVYLVDALALPELEPLRAVCADSNTVKVLHSAENDLAHLKRRYTFTFTAIADTMLAARFLGVRELGLETLLDRYLGVRAIKSQQKTNWARRPLTEAQEAYAADDVRHLIPLHDRLLAELNARSRAAWVAEECEALAGLPVSERPTESDGYRRLRGASRLDPRGLTVLRALHAQREAWAREERRPPFKVLSPDTLVALAVARPRRRDALRGIPGLSPRLVERYGDGILAAITQGLAEPSLELPRPPRRPPVIPAAVQLRSASLKRWRAEAAERTGLDPGVLLPQRLIDALAIAPPRDLSSLAGTAGVRRWRADAFGSEILAALTAPEHRAQP